MIRQIASNLQHYVRITLPFQHYVRLIGIIGGSLMVWGCTKVYQTELQVDFWLLLALAFLTAFTTSTLKVGRSSITYAVDPIVSFAAIPVLGIGPAIVIKSFVTISIWLIKSYNVQTWKKNWQQLFFNSGMHAIATMAAGLVFHAACSGLSNSAALYVIPWIPAALIYDQVNLWLLIGVLRLQQGENIQPKAIWLEEFWATQLFVITYAVGGGLLAFAIQNYDRLGIVIFFLPILLSAYAFHLYVRHMNMHLDSLEEIVAMRTNDLARRTVELEEANRQKDSFLAVLTHDMMTPLSSIRYCADLIRTDTSINEENQRLAELVIRSQETLFHMVRNILDIEKVISGVVFSIHKQPCDLHALLTEIAETMALQAEDLQITFHSDIQSDLPEAIVDAHQIERIVTNLLSNAFKYTNAGGTVWLNGWSSVDEIFISVQDTGYGIAEEEVSVIFERFKRVASHKDRAIGSGLGLAISKALIEEHNGVIEVESQIGIGSKFTVRFPIEIESPSFIN